MLVISDVGPEITSAFSEQTLQPGPPLSLKCIATGNPLPTIEWKLDGFAIPDSSRLVEIFLTYSIPLRLGCCEIQE